MNGESNEIQLLVDVRAIAAAFPDGVGVVPADDHPGCWYIVSECDLEHTTRVALCLTRREANLIAACVNCVVRTAGEHNAQPSIGDFMARNGLGAEDMEREL